MTNKERDSRLMRMHILPHATEEPNAGLGIIDHLRHHGYTLSTGTFYPMRGGLIVETSCHQAFILLLSVKLTLRKLRCECFDTLGHLPGQLGQMRILFQ